MNSNKSTLKNRYNDYHSRAYLSIGNNSLMSTHINYINPKIATGLIGFKIVHISDLHNHSFGVNQSRLVNIIKEEQPDIIVVSGDLIDSRRTDIKTAIAFIQKAAKIAPIYFVAGNHEIKSNKYMELSSQLKNTGVNIIDNESRIIKCNGSEFKLIGLKDASSFGSNPDIVEAKDKEKIKRTLKSLINSDKSLLNVLITHRPELIDLYSECRADLVFSGHAHGGQVRLPFIGGLYAPKQGIFPKYTSGMYVYGSTSLVVSRGLGNSLFPLRIFNPPEVVVLILKNKQP